MHIDFDAIAKQGSLADMAAALPGATQVETDRAFLAAIGARRDAMVDLIFPRARPDYGIFMALRLASDQGYLYGMDVLLPFATPAALDHILFSALPQAPDAVLLRLIARLPPVHDTSDLLPVALARSSLAVVAALLEGADLESRQSALFSAALKRPSAVARIAPSLDVAPVIEALLSSRLSDDASYCAAADSLLPFLAFTPALALVRRYAAQLQNYPRAAALLQQDVLDAAIVPGRPAATPRI